MWRWLLPLLLLGVFPALLAQDYYEEDYEEEEDTRRRKKTSPKTLTTNLIPKNGQNRIAEDCGVELAFLVDSSESAKDNHAQEKQFVIDVVERLQGARLHTGRSLSFRTALLQYSSRSLTEQTFAQWQGVAHFRTRIRDIPYIGQGTYATYAITNLTHLYLQESAMSAVKVTLLLTDGQFHPRNPDIFSAVADAKNQGLRFFMVGITPAANEPGNVQRLRLLANSPSERFLHNLQDRNIVDKVVKEIDSGTFGACVL
ncbi:hypothetical protein ACEWY4_017042 [Coilia grayii]|uniref:VWFA domain-containing protein n=1 Tax=Coilia grayii TaxID=363190 RepID=A0ABD1JMB6_9TELE